jgi:hypothetical protein
MDVRFGVRCGLLAYKALAAQTVRDGGGGRNRAAHALFTLLK